MSRDPIGELGGVNRYGMVSNNPIKWWDWLGLQDSIIGKSGHLTKKGVKAATSKGLEEAGGTGPTPKGDYETAKKESKRMTDKLQETFDVKKPWKKALNRFTSKELMEKNKKLPKKGPPKKPEQSIWDKLGFGLVEGVAIVGRCRLWN